MADDTQKKINEIGEDVGQYTHDAGKKLGQIVAESEDFIESGRKFIKENPVQSVVVAAAAGIVVGSLLTLIFKKNRQD
jgi:ElaB/YqjD/DUF883 family membrane-anchored ribosome-binding protein